MCVIIATTMFKYLNVHISYYFTVTFISATCDSEFKLSWPLHGHMQEKGHDFM